MGVSTQESTRRNATGVGTVGLRTKPNCKAARCVLSSTSLVCLFLVDMPTKTSKKSPEHKKMLADPCYICDKKGCQMACLHCNVAFTPIVVSMTYAPTPSHQTPTTSRTSTGWAHRWHLAEATVAACTPTPGNAVAPKTRVGVGVVWVFRGITCNGLAACLLGQGVVRTIGSHLGLIPNCSEVPHTPPPPGQKPLQHPHLINCPSRTPPKGAFSQRLVGGGGAGGGGGGSWRPEPRS